MSTSTLCGPAFWRAFGKEFLLCVLFNFLIGGFLAVLTEIDLLTNVIFAQSIGLSIFALAHILVRVLPPQVGGVNVRFFAVPLGSICGIVIGSLLTNISLIDLFATQPRIVVVSFVAAVVFGIIISYYFYSRGALLQSQAALQAENIKRLDQERRLTETQLKLLQAQIEPHFLFNTLSNVVGLIETNPHSARRMLEHFTDYLRSSLQRTRVAQTTLDEELALVTAYLEIQTLRMGTRLRYHIDVAAELRGLALPPLLIQPLVENAVKHGLEPKIEGGEVRISAQVAGDTLIIEVIDTGLGLRAERGAGVGLNNIRARLRALYQERGHMTIQPHAPTGVIVRLALPLPIAPPSELAIPKRGD